jgi:hypothetical protein
VLVLILNALVRVDVHEDWVDVVGEAGHGGLLHWIVGVDLAVLEVERRIQHVSHVLGPLERIDTLALD